MTPVQKINFIKHFFPKVENRKTEIRLIQQIFKLKHSLQRRPRNKQEIIILCSFHKENFNLILCWNQKVCYRENANCFINKELNLSFAVSSFSYSR